jgi:hypothetical protein
MVVHGETVKVGSRVRVRDEDGEEEFTIVAECEADAFADRISAESPFGRAPVRPSAARPPGRRVGQVQGAGRHRGRDRRVGRLIAVRGSTDDALVSATLHLVGQSRAFALQLDAARHEIGSLNDARAGRLVDVLGLTLREPAGSGTLRDVEQAASELLRSLRTGEA